MTHVHGYLLLIAIISWIVFFWVRDRKRMAHMGETIDYLIDRASNPDEGHND